MTSKAIKNTTIRVGATEFEVTIDVVHRSWIARAVGEGDDLAEYKGHFDPIQRTIAFDKEPENRVIRNTLRGQIAQRLPPLAKPSEIN